MRHFLVVLLSIFSFGGPVEKASAESVDANARKAVLVTGASSGIGNRIALTLADKGFYVYAGARKAEDIAALSALANIEGIRLDVTVQADIDAAVTAIRSKGRGLYGLVNNAGIFLFDPLIEASERDMQFIFDVNVLGPYRMSKAFAALITQSKGRITTIGSVAGLTSAQLFGPYSMSKFAMEAYTDALAQEMAKFDVAVSIVEPGNFKSDIMKNMQRRLQQLDAGERASLYREEIARFANFTAVDRSHHADPAPVAEAVYHFLTADQPRVRYLVTPNQTEALFTIRSLLKKTLQLNHSREGALSRAELIEIIDELLDKTP